MKRIFSLVMAIVLATDSFAQTNIFPASGNVGIGTTSPTDKLDIIAPNNGLSILSNSPSSYPYIKLGRTSADATIAVPGTKDEWAVGASSGDFVLRTESTANKIFLNNGSLLTGLVIDNNNILIGKTSQTNSSYKLDVNGNIRADQVTVNATGADYVFNPKYHLPSLDSLSIYLKRYHHLPGIASAKQMQTNGVNLGKNQTRLLKKIEELTLYVIKEDKMNRQLQTNLDALKKEVESLKSNSK